MWVWVCVVGHCVVVVVVVVLSSSLSFVALELLLLLQQVRAIELWCLGALLLRRVQRDALATRVRAEGRRVGNGFVPALLGGTGARLLSVVVVCWL